MKDDERSGRPTTSQTDDNIATIDKMVKEDWNVTSRLIADTLGIPKTVLKICPAHTDTRANEQASCCVPRPVKRD